eukprot:TRINITY_DN20274_c0_g2_i1.p1 TRINITY_DN20274_c0_g2~~TRINITY_DN20274_c0_g2_i1.p1  ORF type:complete len:912 (+),score=213.28 TRINITY_DN20274_c0_g2_i1:128-2863(+)
MGETSALDVEKAAPVYGSTGSTEDLKELRRKSSVFEDAVAAGAVSAALLATGEKGLTSEEARRRLEQFGPNKLPEKEENMCVNLMLEFVQPMPMVIWIAIAIEITEYYVEGNGVAKLDACVLLVLQLMNVIIGFLEELKANEEIAALKSSLKPEACVVRDGVTQTIDSTCLVPGDRVILAAGAAVPADAAVCVGQKPIQVDQSALTGESLPVTMHPDDVAKMGSNVVTGESEAIVHFTGSNTFFGKTASLINIEQDKPHFEIILQQLLVMLVTLGFVVCTVIFILLKNRNEKTLKVLSFVSVLLIASIPVALRVVCSCTLALGCKELAEEKAIVARLSSVEELAGMTILCSDKTGTLTLNKMVLQEDRPVFDGADSATLLLHAALAAKWWEPPKDALDTLVLNAVDCNELTARGFEQIDYQPFNPATKRTEAVIKTSQGTTLKVMKGAPDVVLKLCTGNREKVEAAVGDAVSSYAKRGIRSLGIASAEGDAGYKFEGILTFLDPPRPDTKLTIEKAHDFGISVKMITGDHGAIAVETSRQLGLGTEIENADKLPNLELADLQGGQRIAELEKQYGERFERMDGFAQVFPEHKFLIVDVLKRRGHLVGMTGDGVNDAPALKRSDVGIAVSGATDAARACADIVLTRPGLGTVVVAIFTSRKIFQRMKNFVVYRVACTQQLLMFFFCSCVFIHPPEYNVKWGEFQQFQIPVLALVSITILNDGTIISVAYDNVVASSAPEKWNLNGLYLVSSAIGISALAGTLLLLHWALHCPDPESMWRKTFGLPELSMAQIQTVIYLKISLSDYASVFNSRCQGWMFERMPSIVVIVAAAFAMVMATVISLKMPLEMEKLEGKMVGFVWGYVLVWAVIQDVCKVVMHSMVGGTKAPPISEEEIEEFKDKVKAAESALGEGN